MTGVRLAVCLVLTTIIATGGCAPAAESLDWNAVRLLIDRQYANVPTMTTGTLADVLAEGDRPVLLLDARSREEYAVSHLNGAYHAPSADQAQALVEAAPPNTLVVAYCSVGYRSAALVDALAMRGIDDAINLEGSIFAWANEGRPVFRGPDEVHVVHPYDASWGALLEHRYWPKSWTDP